MRLEPSKLPHDSKASATTARRFEDTSRLNVPHLQPTEQVELTTCGTPDPRLMYPHAHPPEFRETGEDKVAIRKRGRLLGQADARHCAEGLTRDMTCEAQRFLYPSFPRLRSVDLGTLSGDCDS
jgi:hypothetical protein